MSEDKENLKADVNAFAKLINDLDEKELEINKDSLLEIVKGIQEMISKIPNNE